MGQVPYFTRSDMRILVFFSRVAFICNVCFVLACLAQFLPLAPNGFVASTIIVLGKPASVALNLATGCWYLLRKAKGKTISPPVPQWLAPTNMCFLFFQFVFFLG
ncbi:MAG TPA: hypothetical protein PK339_08395 [Flavitalea sp.]|nr:hypothetical protein [Flavitalea sp.]